MNKILVLILLTFPVLTFAAVTENVKLTYEESSVVVDYSNLDKRRSVSRVLIKRCSSAPIKLDEEYDCDLKGVDEVNLSTNSEKTFELPRVKYEGLVLANFYTPCGIGRCARNMSDKMLWQQYIIVQTKPNQDLVTAIEKYSPLLSFHPDEEYFPISIKDIFDRPMSDFTNASLIYAEQYNDFILLGRNSDNAAEVLASNGHASNRLTLKKSVSISSELSGDKTNFPIYWIIEDEVPGESVWVTYFVLFSYDVKLYNKAKVGVGTHELDRESISINLVNSVAKGWQPKSVIYAGHEETQPVTFYGCNDVDSQPIECADAAAAMLSNWTGGKTQVAWSNSSRLGGENGRPVVYVAHGTHAMYPGFGFYGLESFFLGLGEFDITGDDLVEPAGSVELSNIVSKDNVELVGLDLSNPNHAALIYSGYLVEGGGGSWHRFFPFIRYPISSWASNRANTSFSDCVENSPDGCVNYIHRSCGDEHPQQRSLQARMVVAPQCGGFLENAARLQSYPEINAANYEEILELHTYFAQKNYMIDQLNFVNSIEEELLSGISLDFVPTQQGQTEGQYLCSGGGQASVSISADQNQSNATVTNVDYANCMAGDIRIHGSYRKFENTANEFNKGGVDYIFSSLLTVDDQGEMKVLDLYFGSSHVASSPADYRWDTFTRYTHFINATDAYYIQVSGLGGGQAGHYESLSDDGPTDMGFGGDAGRSHYWGFDLHRVEYENNYFEDRVLNDIQYPESDKFYGFAENNAFFSADQRNDDFVRGTMGATHQQPGSTVITGVYARIGDVNDGIGDPLNDGAAEIFLYTDLQNNGYVINNINRRDGVFLETRDWPSKFNTYLTTPLNASPLTTGSSSQAMF